MSALLPEGFADLAAFVPVWGPLETQAERYLARQRSRMEDLRALYDALAPRIDAVFEHLDRFPVDEPLPPPERALFRLTLALTEAAVAVEIYDEPGVPWVPTPHHVETTWSDGTR